MNRFNLICHKQKCLTKNYSTFSQSLGSGCGTVDSAVASDIRGPGFESSHRQLLLNMFTVCIKDENKRKEAGNGPFKKNLFLKALHPYVY